jgi:hypothetical protein
MTATHPAQDNPPATSIDAGVPLTEAQLAKVKRKALPLARAAAKPSDALGKLFQRAGLTKGIDTSIVLGSDANHLLVIQAIAADGLMVEKTPEIRMLLEGIALACEKTLALQQPKEAAQ